MGGYKFSYAHIGTTKGDFIEIEMVLSARKIWLFCIRKKGDF